MNKLCKNEPFKNHTTLGIGGPADFFVEIYTEDGLKAFISKAKGEKMPYLVIGDGSNLLVSDKGFNGYVIKNSIKGIRIDGESVLVKAGESLWDLVRFTIKNGLSGMQKMAGIPGTVGGAIYGNAGAYGQTISDNLEEVKIFDGKKEFWLSKDKCAFGYRESVFKTKDWIILEAVFNLSKGEKEKLAKEADETVSLREVKYKPGIKCPGSFFKNIVAEDLSGKQLSKIPEEKIVYGKIPAGYLLEEVEAKGEKLGDIKIADYHANLFINEGKGTASDFFKLARQYKEKVENKFKIRLEPEVQLIGFSEKL